MSRYSSAVITDAVSGCVCRHDRLVRPVRSSAIRFSNPMRAQAAGVFAFCLPVVPNAMPAVERHPRARRSFQSHPLVKRES